MKHGSHIQAPQNPEKVLLPLIRRADVYNKECQILQRGLRIALSGTDTIDADSSGCSQPVS